MPNSTLEQLKTLPFADLILAMDFAQTEHLGVAHDGLDRYLDELSGPLSQEKILQPTHLSPLIKLLHHRISTQTPDHKQLRVITGDTPMKDGTNQWMVADQKIPVTVDVISFIVESQESTNEKQGFTIQFLANPNRQSADAKLIKESGLHKTKEQNLEILLGLLKTPSIAGVPPENTPTISAPKIIPFKIRTNSSSSTTTSQRLNLF